MITAALGSAANQMISFHFNFPSTSVSPAAFQQKRNERVMETLLDIRKETKKMRICAERQRQNSWRLLKHQRHSWLHQRKTNIRSFSFSVRLFCDFWNKTSCALQQKLSKVKNKVKSHETNVWVTCCFFKTMPTAI